MGKDSAYRQTVRKIIPLSMQIAMHATCSDVDDEAGHTHFVEHCEFQADPAALKDVAAALRNNPAVAADLRYQYSFSRSAVATFSGDAANLRKALATLGAKSQGSGNDGEEKRPSP